MALSIYHLPAGFLRSFEWLYTKIPLLFDTSLSRLFTYSISFGCDSATVCISSVHRASVTITLHFLLFVGRLSQLQLYSCESARVAANHQIIS